MPGKEPNGYVGAIGVCDRSSGRGGSVAAAAATGKATSAFAATAGGGGLGTRPASRASSPVGVAEVAVAEVAVGVDRRHVVGLVGRGGLGREHHVVDLLGREQSLA